MPGLNPVVVGFVKFNDYSQQPKDAWQYYLIYKTSSDTFILKDYLKIKNLPPKEVTSKSIQLKDMNDSAYIFEDNNQTEYFFYFDNSNITIRQKTGKSFLLLRTIAITQNFGQVREINLNLAKRFSV